MTNVIRAASQTVVRLVVPRGAHAAVGRRAPEIAATARATRVGLKAVDGGGVAAAIRLHRALQPAVRITTISICAAIAVASFVREGANAAIRAGPTVFAGAIEDATVTRDGTRVTVAVELIVARSETVRNGPSE